MLSGDPVGFIKIVDPPQKLTVYNGYGFSFTDRLYSMKRLFS